LEIKHVIVLMLENRSFDHMLGLSGITGIDGVLANGALKPECRNNRDSVGEPVPPSPDADYAGDYDSDPGHDYADVKVQLYGTSTPATGQQPNMSGFVKSYADKYRLNPAASHRVMLCFAPDKLPVLVTLAKQFAVCDRWFSSLPGPTLPNRLFTHCGTSGRRLDMSPEYFNGFGTIFELLDKSSTPTYPKGIPATSGGAAPLKRSVAPPLPVGLALEAATGTINGTPTAASPKTKYTFTVTDSATPAASSTADLALEIK
jgi:phospholipase C